MMSLLSDVTMQLSLWGHKPSLWYLLSLIKNISSHFMFWNSHKDNKERGGVVIIFIKLLFLFHFLFFFSIPWQSITKKLPCMIFTKKWPLSNIFTSTSSLCFCLLIVCLFNCLGFFLCVCLDYSKTNEQIFIKNLWVEPDWRKKLLKDLDLIMDTKNHEFSEVPFSMYF